MLNFPKTDDVLTTKNERGPSLDDPILFWNWVGLELNRMTTTWAGPQTGPVLGAAALNMLHLAMHDAWFAIHPAPHGTYLHPIGTPDTEPSRQLPTRPSTATDGAQAVTAAALAVFDALYLVRPAGVNYAQSVTDALRDLVESWTNIARHTPDPGSASYGFGRAVGSKIVALLAVMPGEPGVGDVDADGNPYVPRADPYRFRPDPSHSVRLAPADPFNPAAGLIPTPARSHGPFYGKTAVRTAVSDDSKLKLSPLLHPNGTLIDPEEYYHSFDQVVAKGSAAGAPTDERKTDETVAGIFWAYDGTALVGTPPRLYNQILRRLAWAKRCDAAPEAWTAQFARLFALANAAMADAGIYAWSEKYEHEFWRPLPAVRERDPKTGPSATAPGSERISSPALPLWDVLGAPDTNSDQTGFKPPFPAYPSGHATFGAACFQIARLFYKQRDSLNFNDDEADTVALDFVSDEFDGVNRDLYQPFSALAPLKDQPGDIRTRIVRRFPGLWAIIYENAISRIYLGVHWRFDAFAAKDGMLNPAKPEFKQDVSGKTTETTVKYLEMIGGVPLGLAIANDIWGKKLKPSPDAVQPDRRKAKPPEQPTAATFSLRIDGLPQVKLESTPIR